MNQRITIELSEPIAEQLAGLAAARGVSVESLAAELLSAAVLQNDFGDRLQFLMDVSVADDGWWFPLAASDRFGGSGVELDTLRPWLGDRDTVHPDVLVEFCGDAPRQ
jgi:hypothetical protein